MLTTKILLCIVMLPAFIELLDSFFKFLPEEHSDTEFIVINITLPSFFGERVEFTKDDDKRVVRKKRSEKQGLRKQRRAEKFTGSEVAEGVFDWTIKKEVTKT